MSGWRVLRPLVLRLHFYAGVFVAPFLVVAAVTGLMYVYTPQIDALLYEHELHVRDSPVSRSLTDQVAVATAARPGDTVTLVRPAPTGTDTTQVVFEAPDLSASYTRTAFVDPHTAELRGVLETYGSGGALPVRAWVDNLHRGLHLGDAGRLYSELAASWLWVVALGGVALWLSQRRKKNRLRSLLLPERGATGRRRLVSRHGSAGLWISAGLLFLSATGLTWSTFAGENITSLRSALSWDTPAVSTELGGAEGPSGAGAPGADIGFDGALASARSYGLAGSVEITPPETADQAYTVKQNGRQLPSRQDALAVDPGSGEVVDAQRFADYPFVAKLARWGIDAHMGVLFGLPNQLLLTALMLGFLWVVYCGYRLWWTRRPRQDGERRGGAPPRRGSWRRVPGRVLAPLILGAVFVAYFLPLLGASLLAFLCVDGILGTRARRRALNEEVEGAAS
ncbi:PepSY-associated TM helix domain-containing protein [Amycolatopsis antarctica]|nr:PepSY domain-containing protein [Amycolatopsis antarctica]